MKYLLLILLFSCSKIKPDLNPDIISNLKDDLTDCKTTNNRATVLLEKYENENYHLKSELSYFIEDRYAKSNKNINLSDLVPGAKFVLKDYVKVRVFIKLPNDRYAFVIDDSNTLKNTAMGIVNSKEEALQWAKDYRYGKIQ